jgi:predicted component of type VI protein secretion system
MEARINDPRKLWKLSPMDLQSYERWHDYSRARDEMFLATDTSWAPWFVARSDDKRRLRLNVIHYLLSRIPYEQVSSKPVKLPKRQAAPEHHGVDYPVKLVPELPWGAAGPAS